MKKVLAGLLLAILVTACGDGSSVSISASVRANPQEYAVAQVALKSVLKSCGTIDMVTPSSSDPGGYIIDCASGERYRMRAGETVARYERSY